MINRLLLGLLLLARSSDGALPMPDAAAARIFRDAAAGMLVIDLAPPARGRARDRRDSPAAAAVRIAAQARGARRRQRMVENLTSASYPQARVRLAMNFTPTGRPWPLFSASPWQMDVAFPVGDKSFTLPPGRSSRSYEGNPIVPGKIVGLGGHMHDYGRLIEFADATTGEVIYRAAPVADAGGHIESVPVAFLYGWTRLGVHVVPEHRYRVTVSYDNPTGQPIPDGGMGVVGGLFVPDRGVTWPAAEPRDSLYHQDYLHYMRLAGGHEMNMAGTVMPMKMGGHAHHR